MRIFERNDVLQLKWTVRFYDFTFNFLEGVLILNIISNIIMSCLRIFHLSFPTNLAFSAMPCIYTAHPLSGYSKNTQAYTHTHTDIHKLEKSHDLVLYKLLPLAPTIMFIHLSQERKEMPSARG